MLMTLHLGLIPVADKMEEALSIVGRMTQTDLFLLFLNRKCWQILFEPAAFIGFIATRGEVAKPTAYLK